MIAQKCLIHFQFTVPSGTMNINGMNMIPFQNNDCNACNSNPKGKNKQNQNTNI